MHGPCTHVLYSLTVNTHYTVYTNTQRAILRAILRAIHRESYTQRELYTYSLCEPVRGCGLTVNKILAMFSHCLHYDHCNLRMVRFRLYN